MSRNLDGARSIEWIRAHAEAAAAPSLLERMMRELRPQLAELAQKARCLGPLDRGAIVLLTGCARKSGVSSVARALAHVAAAEGSVLLIGDERAEIDSELAIEDRLRAAGASSSLHLLSMTLPADAGVGQFFSTARDALARLRARYELILVDGPSVFDGGSAWAALADATLLVCDSRRSPQPEWSRAWDCLEESGTHVMGIIEVASSFPAYAS